MKIWHTVIALLALLVLGGVLYYLNQQPEKPSSEGFPKQDLFTFQPNQVEEFTIEIEGKPTTTIRRVAAGQPSSAADGQPSNQPQWEIVSPVGIAADSKEVQSFLDGLPKIKSIILDLHSPSALTEYGLDQPQKVFKFKLTGGQDTTLLIGKQNPNGFGRYGKLGAATEVFMLDLMNANSLIEKNLFDLRDRRILPVDMGQAQQLELDFYLRGGAPTPAEIQQAKRRNLSLRPPKVVMSKLPSGDWQLTNPALRTDHGNTGELARLIEGAQVQSFEEENPASLSRYGLAPPGLRLEVKTLTGSYSLMIGNRKSSEPGKSNEPVLYYANNSAWPHVFTVDEVVYSQLTQELEHYRSRYLLDYSQGPEVRRVEIQNADRTIRFDKKGDGWVGPQNAQRQVDGSKVDAFLNYVYALRIQYYASDQPGRLAEYGLDKPWMTVKVITGKDNREETILFGRKNDHFYAARQGEVSVYEMSPDEPKNIESRLKELNS